MNIEQPTNTESESFAAKRIKICQECEHYKAFICTKCGCLMPVKTKLKGSSCPVGKWLPETQT
jgi:hypothetical protein